MKRKGRREEDLSGSKSKWGLGMVGFLLAFVGSAVVGILLGTRLRKNGARGVNGLVEGSCVVQPPPRLLPPLEPCPPVGLIAEEIPDVPLLDHDMPLPINGTRWTGIRAVPRDKFFKKWLKQYPPNTAADHPVLVFAHEKGINTRGSDKLHDFCRVMDVALVPDRPGLCVSVTETNHDMASYHMLTSVVQDGSESDPRNYAIVGSDQTPANIQYVPNHKLSSNFMQTRRLPDEKDYSRTRAVFEVFFERSKAVATALKVVPIHNASASGYRRTQWVGCVVVDVAQADLFRNSVLSAMALGVNYKKFWAFTPTWGVRDRLLGRNMPGQSEPIQTVYLPGLETIMATIPTELGTHFLQAWFAHALAAQGTRMLWQSPATAWLERPDRLVNRVPNVEIVSVYKGRGDVNSEPFFPSFDFVTFGTEDRSVHLLHEVLMHFDLVLAWKSLDAVLSYRLAENNARYGTSVAVLDPEVVMHGDVFAEDKSLEASLRDKTKSPLALALSREDVTPDDAKAKLKDLGYWFDDY